MKKYLNVIVCSVARIQERKAGREEISDSLSDVIWFLSFQWWLILAPAYGLGRSLAFGGKDLSWFDGLLFCAICLGILIWHYHYVYSRIGATEIERLVSNNSYDQEAGKKDLLMFFPLLIGMIIAFLFLAI